VPNLFFTTNLVSGREFELVEIEYADQTAVRLAAPGRLLARPLHMNMIFVNRNVWSKTLGYVRHLVHCQSGYIIYIFFTLMLLECQLF
jgi:hypothetical protein